MSERHQRPWPLSERLPFQDKNDWRWRWLQQPGRAVSLHRVRVYRVLDKDWVRIDGAKAVCGKVLGPGMPGFLSRMGAPRCPACCRRIGIPKGDGAPYNDDSHPEWRNA